MELNSQPSRTAKKHKKPNRFFRGIPSVVGWISGPVLKSQVDYDIMTI